MGRRVPTIFVCPATARSISPLSYGKLAQEYRKNAVNGASPVRLVIMLYDGSIRFMESGKQAILAKDLQKQNDQLQRAQKIVLELMSSLDMQKGGEIAQNLLGLYTFVIEQLIEANMKDLTGPVDESIKIMSSLRESWVQIESQNLAGQSLKEIASVA